MKLQDKVAIITGGGRGLGRAIALLFGREGAKDVVTARNRNQIEHVAQELQVLRKNALAFPADVSDEGQVNALIQKTLETYGTIDILVNNAGFRGPIAPLHTISLKEWEEPQGELFGPRGVYRVADVKAIEAFEKARLKTVFPKVLSPLRLPKTGAPLYSLFFAMANPSPKAIKVATGIAEHLLSDA